MPQGSAGLMRFFQDETNGVKIAPELVVGLSLILIVSVIALRILVPV